MDKLKKNKPQTTESKKNLNKKLNIDKKESSKISLKSLQNELKKAKEDNLRYLAEIDNLSKRFDREREDTFKYAVTEFANEIILVGDNFVRVIESISLIKKDDKDKVKPLIEGVDLIFKDFLKTLEKFEIKQIDCLGKKFDPNFHQAVSEEVNNDKEIGEIIKVVQTGYLIQDRLLRPASVVVAKKEENKKK
jgi:molecular chaperone GrpE